MFLSIDDCTVRIRCRRCLRFRMDLGHLSFGVTPTFKKSLGVKSGDLGAHSFTPRHSSGVESWRLASGAQLQHYYSQFCISHSTIPKSSECSFRINWLLKISRYRSPSTCSLKEGPKARVPQSIQLWAGIYWHSVYQLYLLPSTMGTLLWHTQNVQTITVLLTHSKRQKLAFRFFKTLLLCGL